MSDDTVYNDEELEKALQAYTEALRKNGFTARGALSHVASATSRAKGK